MLLLADGRDGLALVVVGGIDQRFVRQFHQLVEDRIVLRARVAVLEIGAAGAADQQRVAGEYAVVEQERIGVVGVTRRVQHVEAHALDFDAVAFGHAHGDDVGVGLFAHYGDALGAVAQRAEAGDMVGVQMGVDGLDQFEVELAHELQIAVDPLQHRIDDQRLAAMPAGEKISVSAGRRCRRAGGRSWRTPF